MAGAGRMNAQAAGNDLAELILLRALEHQDVLVAGVKMKRYLAAGLETQQRGGGPGHSIAIETVNLDTLMEWLPRDIRLPLIRPGKIEVFQGMFYHGWMGGEAGHKVSTVSSPLQPCTAEKYYTMAAMKSAEFDTAPKTPPCILIILMAAR
jgi:hypothetical protein